MAERLEGERLGSNRPRARDDVQDADEQERGHCTFAVEATVQNARGHSQCGPASQDQQ
jgi:hypothetical protein